MYTKNCIIFFLYTFLIYTSLVASVKMNLCTTISSATRIFERKDKGIDGDNDTKTTYDTNFVQQLISMRTMEAFQLVFESIEVRSLSNNFGMNKKQLEIKHHALVKYRKKMQALQCNNGVIVQSLLVYLKRSIKLKKNETINNNWMIDVFKPFKEYVARMLSVLYYGKTNPHNWLWLAYVKLLMVTEWDTYRESVEDDIFDDEHLMVDLDNFIDMCVSNYYLPVNHRVDETITRAWTNIDSLKSITQLLYNNCNLFQIYKFSNFFVVNNMYLLNFSNQKSRLFEAIPRMDIDWHCTIEQFDRETGKCKTTLENGVWLKKPFECFDYQNLVVQVVSTKLLCYTLVHLLIYRKWKFQYEQEGWPPCDASDVGAHVFLINLQEVIDDLKINKDIFTEIINLLNSEKYEDVDQFDRIITELKAVVIGSLITLKVNSDLVENSIKDIVNRTNYDDMLHNSNDMKMFQTDISSIIDPINFEFVNFFFNGNVSFPQTFYYNLTTFYE